MTQHPSTWPKEAQLFPETELLVIPIAETVDKFFMINRTKLKYKQIAVTTAFAITFNKCQGSTLPQVILDLNQMPGGPLPPLKFSSAYVGLSRVRHASDVRLLPITTFHHLYKLHPNPKLWLWLQGYEESSGLGRWKTQCDTNTDEASTNSVPQRQTHKGDQEQEHTNCVDITVPFVQQQTNETVEPGSMIGRIHSCRWSPGGTEYCIRWMDGNTHIHAWQKKSTLQNEYPEILRQFESEL